MKTSLKILAVSAVAALAVGACSKKDADKSAGGGSAATNSSITGALASTTTSGLRVYGGARQFVAKTITHVMAVSPSTGNVERFISTVAADGSFNLGINAGKPYLIVFISKGNGLVGPDMIVSTVKVSSNDLDTLAPVAAAAVDLGTVTADGTSGEATISTSVDTLLSTLGLTSAEASYLGGVDDLALRLANPDVDMNGEIDFLEDKKFSMDWHIRANTKLNGSDLLVSDIENIFANEANVSVVWTLGSGYAMYPSSFDNVDYVGNAGGVSTTLQNGGVFAYSGTSIAETSHSGNGLNGDIRTWGPDYNMVTQELGGSDAAATFTWTLGASGKQIRFSNVRTKTKAQLNANGVLLPFIKINTTSSKITGIDYKWMKKSGTTWEPATATEVGLLVQTGAYLTLYTAKTSSNQEGLSFTIPGTSATGTINIGDANFWNNGLADPTNVLTTDVCSSALSYDDKMGLRLFAGAPMPNVGVTTCH